MRDEKREISESTTLCYTTQLILGVGGIRSLIAASTQHESPSSVTESQRGKLRLKQLPIKHLGKLNQEHEPVNPVEKRILDDFSLATGLSINFQKTKVVPINVDPDLASQMANTLGAEIAAFPQKYLGLPLSPHKLPPSAFQPIIDRCDIYLAGWCALLLSRGGRLVLLSAVLDSLPTYFMMCFSLPMSVLEEIDKRRRIFFWSNDDSFSGAKCLVAWDRVCMPKLAGGLGVKNLRAQIFCLMLKFAFKFMHSPLFPWKDWILNHSSLHIGLGKNASFLGRAIFRHLNALREISHVTVGDGSSTFFWLDR